MTDGGNVHLVRHGEVANPRHVVYADLPGYRLSELGRRQAAATAVHLAASPVASLVSSPLERAMETAQILAARLDLPVRIDEGLTEWRLSSRWAGTVWEDLPASFPGELEAYLDDPAGISFAPEDLEAVAARVGDAITRHRTGAGDLVVVSHQDPIQAVRLALTGRPWGEFAVAKPGHAAVVTLSPRPGVSWVETARWEPEQADDPFPPPSRP